MTAAASGTIGVRRSMIRKHRSASGSPCTLCSVSRANRTLSDHAGRSCESASVCNAMRGTKEAWKMKWLGVRLVHRSTYRAYHFSNAVNAQDWKNSWMS